MINEQSILFNNYNYTAISESQHMYKTSVTTLPINKNKDDNMRRQYRLMRKNS